jgi:uncharacterized cupredoxin-like copper-binding protein
MTGRPSLLLEDLQHLPSAYGRPSRRALVACVARAAAMPLLATLAGCATSPALVASSPPQAGNAGAQAGDSGRTVTVVLADFSFSPARIMLRVGVPVRLRLVNQSNGGHDFSAPGFFASSRFPAGSTAPGNGAIELASQQIVEVALTPLTPGSYPVACTHFLHSLFGMTATIEVAA